MFLYMISFSMRRATALKLWPVPRPLPGPPEEEPNSDAMAASSLLDAT